MPRQHQPGHMGEIVPYFVGLKSTISSHWGAMSPQERMEVCLRVLELAELVEALDERS